MRVDACGVRFYLASDPDDVDCIWLADFGRCRKISHDDIPEKITSKEVRTSMLTAVLENACWPMPPWSQTYLGVGEHRSGVHYCWDFFKEAYLEASHTIIDHFEVQYLVALPELFIDGIEEISLGYSHWRDLKNRVSSMRLARTKWEVHSSSSSKAGGHGQAVETKQEV